MKTSGKILCLLVMGLLFGCSGSSNNNSQPGVDATPGGGHKLHKLEGPSLAISTAPDDQQNPYVVYLPDKNVWFTVYEDLSDRLNTGSNIKGQFIQSDGTVCGTPYTITNASGNQTAPWTAYRDGTAQPGGISKVMVVWQDSRGTATNGYVYYSAVNVNSLAVASACTGAVVGAETPIGFNDTLTWSGLLSTDTQNVGTGNGSNVTFTGTLLNATLTNPVIAGSVTIIVDGILGATDNGSGTLTAVGGSGISGSVTYTSGAYSITFASAPALGQTIVATYDLATITTTQTIGYGDGATKAFVTSLNSDVKPTTVSVDVSGVTVATDDGTGGVSGGVAPNRVTGLIDYASGALSLNFETAPALAASMKVTYTYYKTYTATYMKEHVNDTLSSRRSPKVSYDPVRDRFWLVWNESRNTLNRISELCFGFAPVAWEFGDNSFPAYVALDGNTLAPLSNGINISGPDVIRNGRTRTNRAITGSFAALSEAHEYEFFTSANNIAVASDTTSPEAFAVWEGVRRKGLLTCSCKDNNANQVCDPADTVTSTFATSDYDGGLVHVYGLFDKEFPQGVISSKKLDSSSAATYSPAVAFDPFSAPHKFLSAWEDLRDGSNTKIYGQLVYSGGGLYNNNMIISYQDTNGDGSQDANVANAKQTKPNISYDTVNQRYFVIWEDGRNGGVSLENLDIYGQYVDGEGTLRGSNYSISIAPANQWGPTLAYNATNNQFLAAWKDARNYSISGEGSDIYGQRFSLGMGQLTLLNLDNTVLSPLLLNFETAMVGQNVTKQFKIRNTGDTFLKVDCLTAPTGTGSPFSFLSLATELQTCEGAYGAGSYIQLTPDNTGAGDYTITVQFQPAAVGTYTSSFTVQSDAETKTINLQGQAVGMTVTPATINFADTAVNQYADQSVTVTNNGTTSFNITSISGAITPFSLPTPPTLPYSLAAGSSLTFTVRFSPQSTSTFAGRIDIATSLSGLNQSVNLTGNGVSSTLTVNPTAMDFGLVTANTSSTLNVTLTNTGGSAVSVTGLAVTGAGFQQNPPLALPFNIAAGASATVPIRFTPSDTIAYNGSLTITSSIGTNTVSLAGSGSGAKISLSQSSMDFGSVRTGSNKTIALTVTNIGTSNLTLSTISSLSSLFTVTYSGSTNLAPNGALVLNVTFSPTSAGAFGSSLTISTNAINGATQTVNLLGTGITPVVNVAPAPTWNFGTMPQNTTANMNVSITNSGTADVQILRFNAPTAPFSATLPGTPYTLAAGATLNIVLDFTPTGAGTFSSSLGILYDFNTTTTFYNMTGVGSGTGTVAGNLVFQQGGTTITTLDFGNVLKGLPSAQYVTILNGGTSSVTLNSATVSDPAFGTALGSVTLAAGGNYQFQITFNPSSLQAYSGTLTVTDTSGGSYQLSLTGTGSPIQVTKTVGSGTLTYSAPLTSAQLPSATQPSTFTMSKAADFIVDGVTAGGTVTIRVTFDSLPANPVFYTIDWNTNTWTQLTPASVSGNTITFNVTDMTASGGIDADLTASRIRGTVVAGTSSSGTTPPPTTPTTPGTGGAISNNGGGCFIATAAYGSYLDPHVMVLRKVRDEYMLTNALGRAFVAFYYRNSPPIADFIRQHDVLRFITRVMLTPLIYAFEYPLGILLGLMLIVGGMRLRRRLLFQK